MSNECCAKCRYIHRLKHNFEQGVGFKESFACDVLVNIKDGEPGWIQETEPYSRCEMFEEKNPFPTVVGAKAEMLVDGKWIKGKIIKGYRFNDGIVTIEAEDGKQYWCGQERTDVYREIKENKDGQ